MSHIASSARKSPPPQALPLYNGDRLSQAEFHRRYREYPEEAKFELIGGTVYMTSPLPWQHGVYHPELSAAFWLYKNATPGVQLLDKTTTILGEESEPQPDLSLRILPEFGGHSHTDEDDNVTGPPELVAEIAHSTRAIDMHRKKSDYQQAGVLEYLVLCVEEQEIYWFSFKSKRPLHSDTAGIFRSRVFSGLWIDGPALLARDSGRLAEVVQQGLATREHATLVNRLQNVKAKGH